MNYSERAFFDGEPCAGTNMRTCTKCGAEYDHRSKSRLRHCKPCIRAYAQERSYRLGKGRRANREARIRLEGDTCAVTLSRGFEAIVDRADYALLAGFTWHARVTGRSRYAATRDAGKMLFMHRLLLPVEDGMVVDHINGNGLDNRRANLRQSTKAQNGWNSRVSRGQSRFRGVFKASHRDAWAAQIRAGGAESLRHLGTFDTEIDAARAYDAAALELHGEFACLNLASPRTGDAP